MTMLHHATLILCVGVGAVLAGDAGLASAPRQAQPLAALHDEHPRLAIVAPMPHELQPILDEMDVVTSRTRIRGRRCVVGELHARPIVAMELGVGMTNAASGVTLLFERFNVEAVVMTGVAGAINRERAAGDVVIVQRTANANQGAYKDGGVFQAYGARDPFDQRRLPVMMHADEAMTTGLARAARESVASWSRAQTLQPSGGVVVGTGITGDCFLASESAAVALFDRFQAECIDMEASVLAQLSILEGKPFAIVRCISDRGEPSANDQYARNMHSAAAIAGAVVGAWVRATSVEGADKEEHHGTRGVPK